jgi:hypothetical protein
MLTKALMSIILITPFLSSVDESFVEKNSSADLLIQDQCSLDLEPLTNGDITVEQLRNPILTSQTEINQRVDLYSNMYDCLDEGNSTLLEEDRKKFQTLLGYFLIFAGGLGTSADETTLDLVSLASSTDPGVAKIRDEAGIEAPDGYVFVRTYASREAMPGLVRRAFESPEVAGVTILSRYIAVLAEDKKTWPQRALQLQTLPTS